MRRGDFKVFQNSTFGFSLKKFVFRSAFGVRYFCLKILQEQRLQGTSLYNFFKNMYERYVFDTRKLIYYCYMKKLIKIFVFFALIILFASSAYAQYNIPDPIPDPVPAADRCALSDTDSAHSPSEACQLWERNVYCSAGDGAWKISGSGDNCTVTSGYAMNGTFRYYYSGDQYCRERTGSSFKNYKTCTLRTDIQPTPIPKLEPAPGFQPLLEKSATQLEIERKAAQKKSVPKAPPKEEDAAPKPIEPGDPLYGSPTILRNGKVVPFSPGFNINPGDVVETGDGITAELISAGGAIYIRKGGTTVQFLGFGDNKVESQQWPTLEDVKSELKSVAKNCSSRDYSACKDYTATIVMKGDVFFSEKMRDTFPNGIVSSFNEKYPNGIVASVTAIMKEFGTEFLVTVAPDGATTVSTFEGSVLVMDIVSKQSALVEANQSITIPKSAKGLTEAELQQRLTKLDPSSIDKWWERLIFEKITSSLGSTGIIILLVVLGYIALIIIKRKQIWPNKFTASPALKEGHNKILTDKYKWLVDNSFATGVFSTMISLYVTFVSQSSQLMPALQNYGLILKNYWLIFFIITILGLIFGLLGMKSPRKAFVCIGMVFNIMAIMLWLKIGMMI
jgi:hypothetical protein